MIPRYSTAAMKEQWSDAKRYQTWFDVEIAVTRAWETESKVPAGTADKLRARAEKIVWTTFADRVEVIEETTRHDVIAFLSALEEQLGEETRHVHYGMTSSDVVDTSFALLLVGAGRLVTARGRELTRALVARAREHKDTLCVGRTHGQAAEPSTFGLKLLAIAAEIGRSVARVDDAIEALSFGKISGAVGNFGNIPPVVEERALTSLGLHAEPLSTQVIPRDRHAQFFSALAILAGALERFAVEVRHLQRTEVSEAFEPFGKGQRGSSAMPHKKNPILTENLTGLCRVVRGYAGTSLENQALWHERDISHSSVERVIGPDATTALEFALQRATGVAEGLVVDAVRMQANLDAAGGLVYSEGVLLALVDTGVLRQEAYGWVQRAALRARDDGSSFQAALKLEPDVASRLTSEKIDTLFDPHHHLAHVDEIFARVEKSLASVLTR